MTGPAPPVSRHQAVRAVRSAGLHRNAAAAVLLGDAVVQLDGLADLAGRIEHHVPGQPGDLAGPQAGLDREQHDQLVAKWVTGGGGKDKEVVYLLISEVSLPVFLPYDNAAWSAQILRHGMLFINEYRDLNRRVVNALEGFERCC